ncbi:hypothetical protein WQ53_12235 [Pseudoxanthomonas suwonensis]|uniref:histidine kinase n=2 Tax=Pseudoxanthomonas suwonensis TaxID=314722 RepID=A0A0E3Z3X5_9GAMM|nr:hypothetical protein WQ53_12235 [Pseudoxanthomonas suwonensis]
MPAGWLLLAGAGAGALLAAAATALRRRMRRAALANMAVDTHTGAMLEALPCAAFVKDARGRYVAVNRAFATLYDCQRSDVLGRTLAQTRHVHGPDSEPLQQADDELELTGARVVREIERPAGDGSARLVPQLLSLQLQPLATASGFPCASIGTLCDVTALREARQAGEAAARTTDTFLSMMGHEIRTPVAGALELVELLAQTPLDQEQAHLLGMLEDSVETLLHIVGDIVDFSRIEAGESTLEPGPCDVRALADGVLALFAPQAMDKGLRLYAGMDWRLAAEYRCDAARLRQVLANLVGNAIRFTEAGHVELRVELAGHTPDGQRLRFTVSDTGIGMSAEHLQRVMQPFAGDGEPDRHRTGLGLALCRRIARLMDGTLDLSSLQDEGTVARLEVVLPVVRQLQPQADMAGRIALLCTRDRRLGYGLANALSALGFNLIEATPADLADIGADDAHLFVVDAALAAAGSLPPGARLLRIVDLRAPEAARLPADGAVNLAGMPLLWRATVKACHAALDLAPPEAPADPAAASAAAPGARILVAEDHPINRAVISRQLQRLGYRHELVENGEQALQALARERFDLLVTDCRMPVLDGYALARRIRASERGGTARLPIIALSASMPPDQARSCADAGMDGFIAKPVQLHELETVLAAHLPRTVPTKAVEAPARPTPADASSQRQLAELMDAFGSPRQVRDVLQRLLEAGRQDMQALDRALRDGDVQEQRELLHRIGGSLRLLGDACGAGQPLPAGHRQRRDALVRRLDALAGLLAGLDPPAVVEDGG